MELSTEVETLLAGVSEAFSAAASTHSPPPPPPADDTQLLARTAVSNLAVPPGPPPDAAWLYSSVRILEEMSGVIGKIQEAWAAVAAHQAAVLSGAESASMAVSAREKDMECFIAAVRRRLAAFDTYERIQEEVGQDPQKFVLGLALASFNEGANITAAEQYRSQPLADVLKQLDEGEASLAQHEDHAQSMAERAKLVSLRDSLLTAVRQVASQSLEKIEQQVAKRAAEERAKGRPLHFPSLYGRFRAAGNHLRALTAVLADCEENGGDSSYRACLDLIEGIYVATRLRLVVEPFKLHVQAVLLERLGPQQQLDTAEVAIAVRQCTTLAVSVAQLELQTFRAFFVPRSSSTSLQGLLGALGDTFAVLLRPLVLRCHLPAVLKEIVECLAVDEAAGAASSSSNVSSGAAAREISAMWSAVYRLRADAQERLLFRVEAELISGIRGFEPQRVHFDYPARLFSQLPNFAFDVVSANCSPMVASVPELEAVMSPKAPRAGGGRLRGSEGWYPAALVLAESMCHASCLADEGAFQALAQAGVESCLAALVDAARRLQTAKNSSLDSCLFLIKHLLVLREQVTEFNCHLVSNEVSISYANVRERLAEGRKSFGNSQHLLNLFVPKLQLTRVDTRRDLELTLKHHCEEFVAHAAAILLLPLLRLSGEAARAQRHEEPLALDKLDAWVKTFQANVRSELPMLAFNTAAYLRSVSFAFDEEHPDGEWIQVPQVDVERARAGVRPPALPLARNTPERLLLNALKAAVTDAVKHVENTVVQTLSSEEAAAAALGTEWWDAQLVSSIRSTSGCNDNEVGNDLRLGPVRHHGRAIVAAAANVGD